MQHVDTTSRIRALNDALRTSMNPRLGRIVITDGVATLPDDMRAEAIRKTTTFSDFSEENDPHGEHDFGAFEVADCHFLWTIDYYNLEMDGGSGDPADPSKTTRVLTILLAAEY